MDEMRVGLQENILVTQDLVKSYPAGDGGVLTVLDHVNYEFPKGKLIMIMGRSGSGKTTLMNILSTLDDATEGEVYFDGTPYSQMSTEEKEKMRRHRIGFVFQSVALIPVMTAYENIDFALRTAGYKGEDGVSDEKARDKRIMEVLSSVGLDDRAKHFPQELSGGERQRVAIARAMAINPELIFADEPTGALDTSAGIYVAELFKRLTEEEGITVIMTTHDVRLQELADKLIQL
jgi:putative ABC transport system ATP-binding protein